MQPSSVSNGLSIILSYGSESDPDEDDEDPESANAGLSSSDFQFTTYNNGIGNPSSNAEDTLRPPKRPRLQGSLLKKSDDAVPKAVPMQKVEMTNATDANLPLPSTILQMFSENGNTKIDDPSLHNGRTRSFPHVRGNWASYLYLPCNLHFPITKYLTALVEEAKTHFGNATTIHLVEDMHLSVSRTLPFRHHWIEPFVSNLKKLLADVESIYVVFDEFDVYTNDDKSRTFVSLKVVITDELMKLVEKCDAALADFQLESYYDNPSFHISCAWMLDDRKSWAEKMLVPFLNQKWKKTVEGESDLQCLNLNVLEFKTGNRLYRFPFTKH